MATYWENSCSFGLRYVSWYKYLVVSLVFSHLGFWSGNLFLIAPFPDLCLLVPFSNHLLRRYNLTWFVSDLVRTKIVSFLTHRLNLRFCLSRQWVMKNNEQDKLKAKFHQLQIPLHLTGHIKIGFINMMKCKNRVKISD